MAQRVCGNNCPDAPFPHIEVTTKRGAKFILCLDCRHYWNRLRGNCKCLESCHIDDLFETES